MSAPIVPEKVEGTIPPSSSTTVVSESAPTSTAIQQELARLNAGSQNSLAKDLAEERSKRVMLESRLASLEQKRETPDGVQFINDPVPILRKELQDTIAPLIQYVNNLEQKDKYGEVKKEVIARYPALGHKLTELEPIIDHFMKGVAPSIENVQAALVQAVGLQALQVGVPSTIPTAAPSTPTPSIQMVPPSVPPAPPTVPSKASSTPDSALKEKVDALTETDRLAAKNMGFSLTNEGLSDFVKLRDAGTDVGSWERTKK